VPARTHQLTTPDGSATTYIARTDTSKVAPMTAVECLPSKLPSCAAADVSATARTLTHAQMQSARTHTRTHHPPGISSPQGHCLLAAVGEDHRVTPNRTSVFECSSISWHQTTVRESSGASCTRAGEGGGGREPDLEGRGIVPPPTSPQGSDLQQTASIANTAPYSEGREIQSIA
jgi:hypothetical protein